MRQVQVRIPKRIRLSTVEQLVNGWEYETTRARAMALVRDRGIIDAPEWVWDYLQDGDF